MDEYNNLDYIKLQD